VSEPRRDARLAAAAALVASAGDLLLLWTANTERPELGFFPPPPDGVTVAGAWLGVLAIPLYALGYRAAACALAPASARAARWVGGLGAYTAAIGAAVHGITAVLVANARHAGVPPTDPLAFVAQSGPYLVPFWVIGTVATIAGSAIFAATVLGGRTALPRWMAAANPALLILVVGTLAAPSAWLRAFLVPAAPNLVHVLFFLLVARGRFSLDSPDAGAR
jgi:uncharacterized protein DUF6796